MTELSKLLRSGALPASLNYIEASTVGATLGADSIREGVTAAIVGVLVVMIFMLIYYKGSGINADLALMFNLIILLGIMGLSSAMSSASGGGGLTLTLTLPGIAGVILTIGMGVDSNVLIFERIREEIRAGKAASAAVDQGFARAWVTIRRYPRHHHRFGGNSVHVRHRAREGLCHYSDSWSCGQSFHRRFCLASDL